MDLNKRLFDLLYESRRTQKELADFLGVNERNVSAWKARGSNPPSELIAPIASFFGMSTDKFLTGSDPPSTNVVEGGVNGGTVVQGVGHDVVLGAGASDLSGSGPVLLRLFNSLDIKRQVRLLGFAFSLEDEMNGENCRGGSVAKDSSPIVRSARVRVSGSCEEWFPVVVENLKKQGYVNISGDPLSFSASGDYPGGHISIVLSPVGNEVEVVSSVTANVDNVGEIVDKIIGGGVS